MSAGGLGSSKLQPMQFAPKGCSRHINRDGKPKFGCRRCDQANASTRSTLKDARATVTLAAGGIADAELQGDDLARAQQAVGRMTLNTEHVVIDSELNLGNMFGASRPDEYDRQTMSGFSNTKDMLLQETHYDSSIDPHKRVSQFKTVQTPMLPFPRRPSFGKEVEFQDGTALLSTGVPILTRPNGYETRHQLLSPTDDVVYESKITTGDAFFGGGQVLKKHFSGTWPATLPEAVYNTPLTSFTPSAEQLRPSIADARATLGLGDDDPDVRKKSALHTGKRAGEVALNLSNQQAIGRHTTDAQNAIDQLQNLRDTVTRRQNRLDGYYREEDTYPEGERLPAGLIRDIRDTQRDLASAERALQHREQALTTTITTNQARLRALGVAEENIPVQAPQPNRRSQTN